MNSQHIIKIDEVAKENKDKLAVMSIQQGDISMHVHEFFELAYVTGGTAIHTLNGEETNVKEGDYFIIDYGSWHGYSMNNNLSIINCLFLPEMIDDSLMGCESFERLMQICLIRYSKQYYGQTAVNRIFHDNDGRVRQLLIGMQEEYQTKLTGYDEIFRCKILEVLILTMRQIIQERKSKSLAKVQSTAVLEAIRFIDTHYRDKSILSQFCKTYHYSLQYMSRRFKEETGITANEYLQNVRIEKSCDLLIGSNLPIQEIACQVGYEDTKYFNKVFRKKVKMSPGEYRRLG